MGTDGSGQGKGRAAAWKVATESAAIDRRRKCHIFFSNNGLFKKFFLVQVLGLTVPRV